MVIKKADIDTRAPFRSVREACSLFGEKVLAGELYSDKIKEMQLGAVENGQDSSKLGTVTAELEETKLSLQKAKEESMIMASYLSSLREELERTKRELQQLKVREAEMESEIEDVKVVEDSTKFEVKMLPKAQEEEEGGEIEFQNKRYVTFANPPSLAQGIVPQGVEALGRHPCLSKKTKKKNPLIPLIGGILSKTKATHKLYSS
uniref:WEB family protein n=1 Tax=Manihot esculenta TaxID=3983 RepID=A0A2C9U0F5_MANES